jgi:hypothetical protein
MQHNLQRQTFHLPLEVQPPEVAEAHSAHLLDVRGRRRLRHRHHPLLVQTSMPHLQEPGHKHETERRKTLKKPRMTPCVPFSL